MVVAFDQPGTTRRLYLYSVRAEGRKYTLIDTAGVRRKGKVDEMIEKILNCEDFTSDERRTCGGGCS
ncbi:GTPase [Acinetobacter baumannii]